ncbi:MAG TPA: PEP-CTERM sorting domain-containing protein [Tepidisphaeraceae bacterium]|jgi:hypothetical protein
MRQGGLQGLLSAGILVGSMVAGVTRADVVYDNVNPNAVSYQPMLSTDQFGDDVTLAPGGRQVTRFSVLLYNNLETNYTGDFTANFYLPDENGLPGTSLWQGTAHVADGQAGDRLVSWDVPNVTVPDSFIWGLSMSVNGTDDIGPYLNDTPTVGTSEDLAYYNDGTGWFAYDYHSDGSADLANLEARIETAVPEPGTIGLVALAGAGLLSARRRRHA